ncbi:MAG TPA: GNAT family N-acetyltransferase [Sphingomonas sp.]|jgi:RimJ/RimL family protein N-acetyltransferase|nr:GNAT family N-acetyltransferase [Sphingomonas sp.]
MNAPTLITPRLTLRAATRADFEAYAAMWADERVTNFIGGEPRDRTLSWTKFTQGTGLWPLIGYGYWLAFERDSGAYVGVGGLACFERGVPSLDGFPEAGWAFGANSWGKGYATEFMCAVLDWSDAQGLSETRCIISPGNDASVRVAQKLGFERIADDGPYMVFSRQAGAVDPAS